MEAWIYRCRECGSAKRIQHPTLKKKRLDGRRQKSTVRLRPGRAPICCQRQMLGRRILDSSGKGSTRKPCGPRCVDAVGPSCACACHGKNHGRAWTLEEMHRHATRYELVAVLPTGKQVRIGFAVRSSREVLFSFAQACRDTILPHIPPDAVVSFHAGVLRFGPVVIRRSGRTERDCRIEEG